MIGKAACGRAPPGSAVSAAQASSMRSSLLVVSTAHHDRIRSRAIIEAMMPSGSSYLVRLNLRSGT